MNDRIRELAEQAGAATTIFDREGHYHIVKPELQNFAELIVGECMNICTETQAEYHKLRIDSVDFTDKMLYCEGETSADRIKYKLKKHFGVSE